MRYIYTVGRTNSAADLLNVGIFQPRQVLWSAPPFTYIHISSNLGNYFTRLVISYKDDILLFFLQSLERTVSRVFLNSMFHQKIDLVFRLKTQNRLPSNLSICFILKLSLVSPSPAPNPMPPPFPQVIIHCVVEVKSTYMFTLTDMLFEELIRKQINSSTLLPN